MSGLPPKADLKRNGRRVRKWSTRTWRRFRVGSVFTPREQTSSASAIVSGLLRYYPLLGLLAAIYWAGADIGRILDTFQPPGVVTKIRFIKNRVGCAGCPATPMVNTIGT